MDIAAILESKYPGKRWELDGDDYEGLNWLNDTQKPSKATLEGFWPQVQTELQNKAQAKIDAKASAIAKLKALGLTINEVEAAFGLSE